MTPLGWIAGKLGLSTAAVMAALVVSALGALAAGLISYGNARHAAGVAQEAARQAKVVQRKNIIIRGVITRLAVERDAADQQRRTAVAEAGSELAKAKAWTPTTIASVESCGVPKPAIDKFNLIVNKP